MITIEEREACKLSGFTSLFVSFKFNPEIITVLKQTDKYLYNEDTKEWEVLVNQLAYLLDNLTYIDDIKLTLYKQESTVEKLIPKGKYKTEPFKHQLDAIKYGLEHPNWLLQDQPGLGKTLSTIYLAQELKEQKGLEHCLIICAINTLKANWKKEIITHSDLSYRIIGERKTKNGVISYASIKDRAKEILNPINEFFIIINIESLRDDEIIQAFKKTKNKIDMIVVDEIHRCANPSSDQGKNLLKLTKYNHKVALSGTLISNNPLSTYLPLKWIGAEKSTLTNFKGQYCEFGGFGGHQIIGYKNIDILKDLIDRYSLRRTKELLDIPPKNIIKEIIELEPQHREFYENIKEGIKDEALKVDLNPNNVLALATRLRQATVCPSILTESNIISSKLKRAVELAEEIVSQGDKVVIMSVFKDGIHFGIAICGSGIGISIALNKMKGVYCAKVNNALEARYTRLDNNTNVVSFSGDTNLEEAIRIVDTFIHTEFSNLEKHIKRINKVKKIEENNYD